MSKWKSRLRDADPGKDAAMSPADVQRIRNVVMSAAGAAAASRSMMFPRAFVVTATLLVMICASMLAVLQGGTRHAGDGQSTKVQSVSEHMAVEEESTSEGERQQLHFMTPGGTRIIWVFDSQFDVKGTLP